MADLGADKKGGGTDMKAKLSALWIVVMFSMVYADIISLMDPTSPMRRVLAGASFIFRVDQGFLLASAVAMEMTIVMIFLSRALKYKANRLANIIVGTLDIMVTVTLVHRVPYYIFFSVVEVIFLALIVWNAWKWRVPESA